MPYFGIPIRNGLPIGLGTVAGLASRTAAPSPPPVTSDPYFEYVPLLLNTTSTNGAQNNTFLDSSTNNFTITRNGDTTQGSFTPYMPDGYWGAYFDGTGDYLTAPDNAAFDFGSGDFTIEAWVFPTTSPAADPFIWGKRAASGNYAPILIGLKKNGTNFNIAFWGSLNGSTWGINGAFAVGTITISQNTWTHIAVVRSGTTITSYVNGAADLTVPSISGALMTNATATAIGASDTSGSNPFPGYVSNLRAVKGTAVYTANFTPPTAPLTAITNTSLLACQSNRFIDNSSNAFAITRNGDTRISKLSPFNPPASWSAATYGGSGYFDGTGDYLTVPAGSAFAYGTGDFTVEGWVYITAGSVDQAIFTQTVTGTNYFVVYVNSSNVAAFIFATSGGGTTITASAVNLNAWNHIAVCRTGTGTNQLTVYVNGVGTSGTCAQDFTNTTYVPTIGRYTHSALLHFIGYISNLRVVKGTAVYTANFTPPTTPLTAITNTSLLLNFTNAGIYDASTINDGQTVGNAQVSTTVAKWGSTSMAFDGTGDSFAIIDKPELRLGTAPFTIEGWVYLNVINATQGIASKRNATPTGWFLQVSSSNKLQLNFDASTLASTGSLAASAWYHFAVVREGTGANQTKLYINGVNDGTGTVANNFNQTDALAVGSDRGSGSYLNGYLQDVRITNGYARYTANFTPPTAAFPTS